MRTLVKSEMVAALAPGRYDALLTPAAPSVAYRLGEKSADPLSMYKGDLMTVNVNLAGLPAIVLPCGYVTAPAPGGEAGPGAGQAAGAGVQLPVGLQLVGRAFGEAELLRVAHTYEQTAPLPAAVPPCMAAGWGR